MPLSEDEQRILRQIEEQLQRDPSFARDLHARRPASRRGLVLGLVGAVLALAMCIALLSVSPYLSLVAFVAAVLCTAVAERHVRDIGEAGLNHLSESVRSRLGGSPGARGSSDRN
jgi:ferric-dicitrate binding protein FerR (iron transport regulator)